MRLTIAVNYRHFGFTRRHNGNSLHRLNKGAQQAFDGRCVTWSQGYGEFIFQYLTEHGIQIDRDKFYVTCLTHPIPGRGTGPIQIYVSGDSGGRDWRREDANIPDDIQHCLRLCWSANALWWAEWPSLCPRTPLQWDSYSKD